MHLTKLDLAILVTNLLAFGAIGVVTAFRGPSVPAVLLAIGTGGLSVAKIAKAVCSKAADSA